MNMYHASSRKPVLVTALVLALGASAAAAQPGPMMGMSPEEAQKYMENRPGGYGPMGMGGMGMMDMMMGRGGGMMGPGMMGGMGMMGMGPGMMGGMEWYGIADLTDDQRGKLNKIQDEHRKKHWDLMGKVMDESSKLRDLYQEDTLDAKKIGAVYDRIFKLQRESIDASIDARNKANAVLTKEQREKLKQWHRGAWGPHGMMWQGR
jgi:Spy/CpxP family protein refolding chaperone